MLQDGSGIPDATGMAEGVSSILGVRLPELRKMAKQMARADWRENLRQLSDDTFSPKTREKIRAMKK